MAHLSADSSTPKLQLHLSIPIPSRDHTYYIADGNTVLLVENTLFKVHRSTLTKDASTFDSMFSLDSDLRSSSHVQSVNSAVTTVGPEGENDETQLDQFRALLWALYSLPHELSVALTPEANPSQLFNLARISHKYEFRSIEAWALNALDAKVEKAHCLGKDISLAINVAERLNCAPFSDGHTMPCYCRDAKSGMRTGTSRGRRLSGCFLVIMLLADLWERLPNEPPPLTHSSRCMGAALVRCNQTWAALWKSMMDMGRQGMLLQYPDVEGKLVLAEGMLKTLMERDMPAPGLLEAMPWSTAGKIREIQESLVDYFTDV
ncbi:hypothetical protein BKA82DRAFT_4152531 [Pisolithus tinctorius]|nr:hypothetical protein BKA82DRAFT_4152531 [Pisolithus tinctorius]